MIKIVCLVFQFYKVVCLTESLLYIEILSYFLMKPSPPVSTPFLPVRAAAAAAAVEQKSCFDLAENFEASSLWVGAHRYTRISCESKLLWV